MAVRPRPASDKPKPDPIQGSVVKPPAGFTPIPHSKKGGYHKQVGAGKYMYWYPGQGIVGEKHEADADATPYQEETAKHVMEQIETLEAKKTITREELQHTQAAIRNAWPGGPQDVPRHIMDHYHKLQEMVPGEPEKPPKEKPPKEKEPEVPEVKIKRPGEAPMTTKELREKMEGEKKERAAKKEAAAQKREEKRKAAREKVITDYKKVPDGFNKLDKMKRAKLTANWDQVKEDLDANYAKADYLAHPDMRQAITEHVDELAEAGQIVPTNACKAKAMLLKQLEYGEKAGVKKEALASLLEENTRKLAHQEVESVKRTLGDHGVRHLAVNAHQANRIFDQLEAAGIKVTPMDRFMTHQVMIDHDMGYTIPVIVKGGFKIKDNYHPQASAVLAKQQGAKYRKLFGSKMFKEYQRHVETHSGSNVDWKNDPVGSTVHLADNTHLFADKLPEVLFDTNAGVEVLTKIKLADQVVPKSLETVDDKGNVKLERTPEEKAEFKALIGGIKGQLAEAIRGRGDLPKSTKELLAKAVDEIGALTPKFLVSRLAGREPKFAYDKKTGDMSVNIEQSPARQAIGEIFGDDETDKQFTKMLEDFGTDPAAALEKPPPPRVRIGEEGNGIDFSWRKPTGEHPNERRYAKVMRDTKARLGEIQAMKGPSKASAIKRFFGAELAKAMAALAAEWALMGGLEELEKAAGPYIGPRGGKWADVAHTIPWAEPKAKTERRKKLDKLGGELREAYFDRVRARSEHSKADYALHVKLRDKPRMIRGRKKFKAEVAELKAKKEAAEKKLDAAQARLREIRAKMKQLGVKEREEDIDPGIDWGHVVEHQGGKLERRIDVGLMEHQQEKERARRMKRYRKSLQERLADKLEKASAMAALAARTGRKRPSAYAPLYEKPKVSLKDRLKTALGRRPPGVGWIRVPGGKKGGYRKMQGGRWIYWYPGMGKEGGSQQEAERHQAKKEIAHHEKQSNKWRERAAKRSVQGQASEHVESARARMHEHAEHARWLREKHGIRKSEEDEMREQLRKALPGKGAPGGSKTPPKGYPESKKEYADPANYKYPLDTEAHVRAAISYFSKPKNAGVYSVEQQKAIWGRIKSAAKKRGIELSDESGPPAVQKTCKPGMERSMVPEGEKPEGEEIKKPTISKSGGEMETVKSVMVGRCQVHLTPDEALAKALEDGDLGIGTVPRTYSSKTMNRLEKAVGGEGQSEHGQDMREAVARGQQDDEVLRDDPAGNDGNGGLSEWFADAQRTQEPMVRTPAVMAKSEPPPTVVIDDDDPYTRRLHQADPRDKSAAFDIDQLFKRQ